MALYRSVTGTESEAAAYEFTTLTCIPGVIHYKGTKIQLLDLPGIIEGAASGKGRGRQVIAVAKSADLVLMFLDATKPDAHRVRTSSCPAKGRAESCWGWHLIPDHSSSFCFCWYTGPVGAGDGDCHDSSQQNSS